MNPKVSSFDKQGCASCCTCDMTTFIIQTLAFCREWCFGTGCVLCGVPLIQGIEFQFGLCNRCQEDLTLDLTLDVRCTRCGRPLISEKTLCITCRQKAPPPQDIALALYPYQGKAKKLLEAYKFKKNLQLGWFLAFRLLQAADYLKTLGYYFDAWVPVPPRSGKLKEKGWDQIDRLCHYLAKLEKQVKVPAPRERSSMPIVPCLTRLPSVSQKKLHRNERAINLRGKIRCVQTVPERALLIDDVMTTGSTLRTCAEALKTGGAKTVGTIALFYD